MLRLDGRDPEESRESNQSIPSTNAPRRYATSSGVRVSDGTAPRTGDPGGRRLLHRRPFSRSSQNCRQIGSHPGKRQAMPDHRDSIFIGYPVCEARAQGSEVRAMEEHRGPRQVGRVLRPGGGPGSRCPGSRRRWCWRPHTRRQNARFSRFRNSTAISESMPRVEESRPWATESPGQASAPPAPPAAGRTPALPRGPAPVGSPQAGQNVFG